MSGICRIGSVRVGNGEPLAVIAGPCVLEDPETNLRIGRTVRDLCHEHDLAYIFKASFDKANRSSITSERGPGLEGGLEQLAQLKEALGVPVTTDVHEPAQAAAAAEVVDLLQVPAFLVRQTELITACGKTGRPVNAKKGQFMAPEEMRHVSAKLESVGCHDVMLTERGTFFGYHRLVNDFVGLEDMMRLGHPVCFDVTHSTQLPGPRRRAPEVARIGPLCWPGPRLPQACTRYSSSVTPSPSEPSATAARCSRLPLFPISSEPSPPFAPL